MNTIKCPQCNLTNWATADTCKRCGNVFQEAEASFQPVTPPPINNPQANFSGFNQPVLPNPSQSQQASFTQGNYRQQDYQPHYQQQYSLPKQKQGIAIASMVLGIIGFVLGCFGGFLLSPIGLILGIVSLVKSNKRPQEYGGKGFAIAGVILNAILVLSFPIIASIAVPNLLAARRSANEGSAIASIRTIHSAEMTYQSSIGKGSYAELSQLSQSGLIDGNLASGQKSGYKFLVTKTNASSTEPAGFKITAVPMVSSGFSSTGLLSFYMDEAGVMHASNKSGQPASAADPVLESSNRKAQLNSDNDVPTLVAAKGSADEASAISALRVFHGAEITYQATSGAGNFGEFSQLSQGQLISADLASGQKSGYKFVLTKTAASGTQPATFSVSAVPILSSNGGRSFYIDETGLIRGAKKSGLPADKTDPTLD